LLALEHGVLECEQELTPGRYEEIVGKIEVVIPRPY
jgi:hypothetical protein